MNIKQFLGILSTLLVTASCANEATNGSSESTSATGMPVCFSSGASEGTVKTRATVPYMQNGGKFVARMYYQGAANSENFNAYTEAFLAVNNTVGNCVYRQTSYTEPDADDTDAYGFDRNASIFYWQNRKPHVFYALTDANRLTESTCPFSSLPDAIAFSLKTTEDMTSTADQPDPILAHTTMTPSGATPEANRVKLFFNHCFAQVEVNLKPSVDGGLDGRIGYENIDKVELLGVAEEATVFALAVPDSVPYDTTYQAPQAKDINMTDYTADELTENPYGTAVTMFKATEDNVEAGYITTHDIIAFGKVQAIRITWHETNYPTLKHVVTKATTSDDERLLRSGCRHIFNLELRRGTLAIINAEIAEWGTGATVNVDGTIKK